MPADETTLLSGGNEDVAAAEFTYFLMETSEHIAEHWKAIMIMGVVNVMTGVGCLLFPVFSTQLVELFLVSLVFATGLLNMMAVCASSSNHDNRRQQSPLFWVGFSQVLVAILMYLNPFVTLTIMTLLIAVTFMLLGSVQFALARQCRGQMAARALMMGSGILAVLMSITICLSLDLAKWYAIGVLVGVNLVNIGMNRIVMGLYGRKLANSDGSEESWRAVLDADFV